MDFPELVAGVLQVDPAEVVDSAGPTTLGTWTSLRHLQLVVALEEVYGLRFSREEIRTFTSIGHVRTTLREKGIDV